ncbi:MAG TPA: FHA domain-containing protein [Pirellulales bacterium]|jgi:adenylate cyclase|nr:FHA domain-containing protein [Pirellulales bacterium]
MFAEPQSLGELVPIGGGDPIPLLKRTLLVGRRESCDIVLRFPNVSTHHCQLTLIAGYWYVKDQASKNGVKVNGSRVTEKRLDPGDELAVAKHKYEINYSPIDLGAVGPPPAEDQQNEIFSKSLLERAGLTRPGKPLPGAEPKRYNVLDNSAGQIKDPNRIV